MKKTKKVVLIILVLIILFQLCFFNNVYAVDTGLGNLDAYKGTGAGSSELTNKAGKILGGIQIIGTIVAVTMLIVIGIKYMLGSVEEKANYKETMKPYLLGAFLIFTGTLVPQIIYKISQIF